MYIKLIQWALEQGRTAMVLVPEISLTPQLLRRFCAYFKEDVAVFHSGLTPGQRYDEYKRVKTGKARAVRVDTLNKLCRALDCQPGDLLEYRPGPENDNFEE